MRSVEVVASSVMVPSIEDMESVDLDNLDSDRIEIPPSPKAEKLAKSAVMKSKGVDTKAPETISKVIIQSKNPYIE